MEQKKRLYVRNKEAWQSECDGYRIDNRKLRVFEVERAILLPPDEWNSQTGEFRGGVCDEEFHFISGLQRGKPPVTGFYGVAATYETLPDTEPLYIDESVIFGGILIGHFGHFILECFGRIYYVLNHPEDQRRIVFLVEVGIYPWFWKFFELMGIPQNRIILAQQPVMFRHLTVPEEAVHSWWNYTAEYLLPYKRLVEQAKITSDNKSFGKKIFLTRRKLEDSISECVNEEYFIDFFAAKGYVAVEPEEYSIEDQISIIANAEEIVAVMGSLTHWAMFCKPGTKFLMLTRTGTDTLGAQCLVNNASGVDWCIVDVSLNFLYASRTMGVCLLGPTGYWLQFVWDKYRELADSSSFKNKYHEYMLSWIKYYLKDDNIDFTKNINLLSMLTLAQQEMQKNDDYLHEQGTKIKEQLKERKHICKNDKNERCRKNIDVLKRKEILFLPYKASMWDSMESVWEATRDDENCHAVVVPIPYAILSKDGSVKEWQCEADIFPSYVSVIDWHTYDIESRRPDVIYIHNPYDDTNRLTQVEPRFFSRNLRKCTDMLVYIPYFALTGMWPEMHLDLPCYEQVDKIIVQSSHYQIINGTFFEEDNACLEDVMPSGKLVVLGSPKLDKMAKIDFMYKFPDSWATKLGRRKTVFYNTTVSPLLTYGKRGLCKMWQVYYAIKRHVDMAFIWRPHPLLESMLGEQHPELVTPYIEWKKAICDLPQVIYDDSSDLERTVALSDAYIGECSSVVQLFAMSGKPVFYNDMTICYSSEGAERNLAANGLHVEGDRVYFWAHYWNAICEMDLISHNVNILYKSMRVNFAVGVYSYPQKYGHHLIFTPVRAGEILDYDIENDTVREISLEKKLEGWSFYYSLVWQGKVIMLGCTNSTIIAYDVKNGIVEKLLDLPMEIKQRRSSEHPVLLGKGCIWEDILYAPVFNANEVLALDLRDNTYKLYTVGDENAKYGFATTYAGNIWLAPSLGGPLVVWHPATGAMQVLDQFPRDFAYENVVGRDETKFFVDSLVCDKYWWLLPACAKQILRVDMESGEIQTIVCGGEDHADNPYMEINTAWGGGVSNNKVYVWMTADRNIYCFDNETGQIIDVISPRITKEIAVRYKHELGPDDFQQVQLGDRIPAVYEDGINRTQEAFFRYVKEGKHDYDAQKKVFEQLSPNSDGHCGRRIHEYIMRELVN